MSERNFDVIVVGGGPAGSSAASFLAKKGYRTILLEKETFPRFHIGESLVPGIWDVWDALGVTAEIEDEGFVVKQGVKFALFDAPQDIDLLTNEYPEYFKRPWIYHVDRARFDEILINHASASGADVRQGWMVKDVLFEGSRAVGVTASPVDDDTKPRTFFAPIVVDATGRSSLLARKLGWRKTDPTLNKVSYFTHFKGADRRQSDNGNYMTEIHSIDGGWIWYIPLSDDIVSVGAVVNSKHEFGTKDIQARFDRAIAECTRISEWVRSAEQIIDVKVISSISYLNDCFVGDGFVMIGDASMFIDPIFSAGVTLAMRGAMFASETIDEAFQTRDFSGRSLSSYEKRIRHPMNNIFKMIYNWYKILDLKDPNNLFFRSRNIPILRERLIVLLSGGYDRADLDGFLKEEEKRLSSL